MPSVGRMGDMTRAPRFLKMRASKPIGQGKGVRTLSRTQQARLRRLRLDLLEAPWDSEGREIVQAEMEELGLSKERLYIELWNAGWEHSFATMRRWLDPKVPGKPDVDELRLLTAVLAGYSANWPKASNLSSPRTDYSFSPIPRVLEDLRLPIPA